jgi:parallel beta-helix repeat protein
MCPAFLRNFNESVIWGDSGGMSGRSLRVLIASIAGITAGVMILATGTAIATTTCNKVASPAGSDSAVGTAAAPYRTVTRLVAVLSSGQTGCLRTGTYTSNVTISTPNVTLTSYPGERATLKGVLYVSRTGTGVTVSSLNLDGKNSDPNAPSPQVMASDVTFSGNDVSNENSAICFIVGSATYGHANNVVIENNDIHNCGVLPAAGHDHGIYIEDATGTIVRGNWIHNNADWGVHIYPNGDHSLVTGNVIDSNGRGVIFAGSGGQTSDYNVVEHNIITNSLRGYNADSSWDTVGVGNVLRDNCIKGASSGYAGPDGSGIERPQRGFTATDNLIADPLYVDAAHGDYNLKPASTCASILAGANVDPSTGPVNTPPGSSQPSQPSESSEPSEPSGNPTPGGAPTSPVQHTHNHKNKKKRKRAYTRRALNQRGA